MHARLEPKMSDEPKNHEGKPSEADNLPEDARQHAEEAARARETHELLRAEAARILERAREISDQYL